MKKCTKCQIEKDLSEFYFISRRLNTYRNFCISCLKIPEKDGFKTCIKCGLEKEIKEYPNKKNTKDGLSKECSYCIREYKLNYLNKNSDKVKETNKRYREKTPDFKKRQYENQKKYLKTNKRNDPKYKIAKNLRSRTRSAIIFQGGYKSASTEELLGCSFEEAAKHIEAQFTEGMNWENYGKYGWHIDHIKPLTSFDLTDPEQQKQACHWSNLQPLWAKDNYDKELNRRLLLRKELS